MDNMTITTLDGMVAGFQPGQFFYKSLTGTMAAHRPRSLWNLAGIPGPGSFDNTLNGVTLSSPVSGQIPYTNPSSGSKSYLARFCAITTIGGTLLLCDRIWHNGGIDITSTSEQLITSPTWPARDADGTTNGKGILLGVEVSAATGTGTPTLTLKYTNSDGTSDRTGTNIIPTVASAPAGTFYMIGLQTGDQGVRAVESIKLSNSWTSGTINIVAYRVLSTLEIGLGAIPNALDPITGSFPICYDNSVPFLIFVPASTTTTATIGQVFWSHG